MEIATYQIKSLYCLYNYLPQLLLHNYSNEISDHLKMSSFQLDETPYFVMPQSLQRCLGTSPVLKTVPTCYDVWTLMRERACSIMQAFFFFFLRFSLIFLCTPHPLTQEKRIEVRIDSHHYWSKSHHCTRSHRPAKRSEKLPLPSLCQKDLAACPTIDLQF